jgi:putative ABC transport system substrate-binding protein
MYSKVLSLLHELVPKAVRVGVLAYPTGINIEANLREVREAAPTLGLQIQAVNASTIGEINAAFAALARERADALFNPTDAWRQVGVYTGNILLRGAKPAELPVQRSVKFAFVINQGTATLLGIEVPPQLLAIADEVIE